MNLRVRALSDWLEYIEALHPTDIELGLERLQKVVSALSLDFSTKTVISIAGTNGKGSTACFLANLLQASGQSTALYTSPHLLEFNERIRINGKSVSDEDLCQAFMQVEKARDRVLLTYFEFTTLAALLCFMNSNADFIILEVGLGGRLDAVNIINADMALITNIALDHIAWLGDTREQIAREKAGIIRSDKPVLYGETDVPQSITDHATALGAHLFHLSETFNYRMDSESWYWQGISHNGNELALQVEIRPGSLLESYPENAALALQAACLLPLDINHDLLEQAYRQAVLTGRFQIVPGERSLVLDVAHNPHAAKLLVANIRRRFPGARVHMLIAMLADKDIKSTLSVLQDSVTAWYVANLENSRGSAAKMLYNELRCSGQNRVQLFDSVEQAFRAAERETPADNVLVVTGSFYTVAAVLELI